MNDRCALIACVTFSLFLISATVANADPDSDPRVIVVRAVDSSGQPIGGANILRSVWTNQKDFKNTEEFVTDDDGVATVSLPETMTILRIWVRKKSLPTLFANWGKSKIADVPEKVEFVVPDGTTIGGVIASEIGEPIVGATIELRHRQGGAPMKPWTSRLLLNWRPQHSYG